MSGLTVYTNWNASTIKFISSIPCLVKLFYLNLVCGLLMSVCACAYLSVFCWHMMGLESRWWQITCNCDLLWWGINFVALHAVKQHDAAGIHHSKGRAGLMVEQWDDKIKIIQFFCDLRQGGLRAH